MKNRSSSIILSGSLKRRIPLAGWKNLTSGDGSKDCEESVRSTIILICDEMGIRI